MSKQFQVATTDQLLPGQRKLIQVEGQKIVLFNVKGSVYALNNRCPHSTGPLNEGRLYDTTLTCPWHGAQFDITTGQCLGGPATQDVITHLIQLEGHDIFIELNTSKPKF